MTPEQHYARAHWWGNRFDEIYSGADPIAHAGLGLSVVALGAWLWDSRAGIPGLALQFFWFGVRMAHRYLAKLCVWRLQVHGKAYVASVQCSSE
jgi:hypothetical protein